MAVTVVKSYDATLERVLPSVSKFNKEDFPTEGNPMNATCASPVLFIPKPPPPPFLELAIRIKSSRSLAN